MEGPIESEILQIPALQQAGWVVHPSEDVGQLPDHLLGRYPWIPENVQAFLRQHRLICRPDEKAWLLLAGDFRNESGSAFAWNELELQSLNAAEGNEVWRGEIQKFWDAHLPIALTVDDGYGYYALRADNTVVYGREPEYEQTEKFADSYLQFLELLAGGKKFI